MPTPSSSSSRKQQTVRLYAANAEEDLELTRQIILNRMRQELGDEATVEENDKAELDGNPPTTAEEAKATEAVAQASSADVSTGDEATSDDSPENSGRSDEGETTSMHTAALAVAEEVSDTDVDTECANDDDDWPANDLMIRAARGELTEKAPLWLFRQAGRHLPEYQAYKAERKKTFLQLLMDPASVAECTMQPIRRYPVDAAILFSDILVIAEALGIRVTMPGGVGIQVPEPLLVGTEVKTRLIVHSLAEITPEFVQETLGHVLAAVRSIRYQMKKEGISIPLIGFSAAPWTLMYYIVGGSSKKNTSIGVKWLEEYPVESQYLLDLLTKIVIEYMSAQVKSGCHLLQVFEAMGMMIDEKNFERYALPCLEKIGKELKSRHPGVPLMVFARGACQMNPKIAALGCFDVLTLDGAVDRSTVRDLLPEVCLQGNYDPRELIEGNGKTAGTVRETARAMLEELGPQRLIANLGEGLGGKESPALVEAFVNAIHEESQAMIAAAATERSQFQQREVVAARGL